MATIATNLLSIDVSYTIDMANQLTFTVLDPGFEMGANNYFQVGRDVVYETTSITPIRIASDATPVFGRIRHIYEISRVSVAQNQSASPTWTVEAMPKAVQQMKRDKKPGSINGSGYTFARNAALKYGLSFVGEKSAKIKSASKNSGDGQADSVWSVLTQIASDSQYVCFVSDGVLYFASEKWLMYKRGSEKIKGKVKKDKKGKPVIDKKKKTPVFEPDKFFVPMEYSPNFGDNKKFEVLSLPKITKGENDPMEGSGSLTVARDNGVALRPGMTIRINNVPTLSGFFLITSVSFSEQKTDPVSVEFRTPERLKVDGKEPKIPQLPIGKTFSSEYPALSPKLGATTVGSPSFSDTIPKFVQAGSTVSPIGPQAASQTPNARRPTLYPTSLSAVKEFLPPKTNFDMGYILENGNIDLWNRPLLVEEIGETRNIVTTIPHIFYNPSKDYYVITERLWCGYGFPIVLSELEAEEKFDTEFVHHGILGTSKNAEIYVSVLAKIQKEVIKKRFPVSYEKILDGTAVSKTFQQPVYPTVSQITEAGLPPTLYPATPTPIVYGNINLLHRPLINNEDGSISTLLTSSFNDGFNEVLYTPIIDGIIYSDEDAQQHYLTSGEHLGKFASGNISDSETYAENLHIIQEYWLDLITYQELKAINNGGCL